MSTKAMPLIPPRPTRAQDKLVSTTSGSTLGSEIPKIPPRPINRRLERSQSPHRDSFAPSPLNEPSFIANYGNQAKPTIYSSGSANVSSSDLPRRPSSVTLPSLGQEGNEYAEVFTASEDLANTPTQTRSVANDLHLHAPKPSLPVSSAKQRVSTVTRTDSTQAAALGIGKANSDDTEPQARSLKTKASFASQNSNGTERPPSISDGEHGIPEIGQRVPMYPNAGDVQAPSPAPFATPYAPGVGFHNDGSKPRHHGRRTSARGFEGPPGSYGLHGHGVIPNDRFEKAYYEKHPELLRQEAGQYSGALADGRGEWALSSDDLNKIVRETASRGAGLGTSPAVMSTPSEQIGFLASEEYATRLSSPRPQSAGYHHKAHSNHSQTHVDSHLGKESIPGDSPGTLQVASIQISQSENAPESEVEDDDVVHIDAPERRLSVVYGAGGYMESTESLGQHASTPGLEEVVDELAYNAPILAADEVAKDPFGYELQPAVSPNQERGSAEQVLFYRTGSASSSRPSSRPVSIHGGIAGIRFQPEFDREAHHTPLEDLHEYEPLFPEDEKISSSKLQEKTQTIADKLRRLDLKNRKFPSQDIWEDAPNSLHYTATVTSPQLPEESDKKTKIKSLHVREGETQEQAFARRQEELAEQEASDPDSFLNREKKPWISNPEFDSRLNSKGRFPSRDIWESTPDSLQLTTTVSNPQIDERDIVSPPEERPTTGAVAYHQEKSAAGLELGPEEGRATTGIASTLKPQVPARPMKQKPVATSVASATSSPTDKVAPPIPVKSKPQIPVRPAKVTSKEPEMAPLTKVTSASSTKSVESDQGSQSSFGAKPKPLIPSRPVGSKIAALQGDFMSDLNKRLKVGPQPPKKEEPVVENVEEEKEKAPLSDARKGRAKGPARRTPTKSPAPATEMATVAITTTNLGFSKPAMQWTIDPDDGSIEVSSHDDTLAIHSALKAVHTQASALATGNTGQSVPELNEASIGVEHPVVASESPIKDVHAQDTKDQPNRIATVANKQASSSSKISEDPPINLSGKEEAAVEELSASTATIEPDPKLTKDQHITSEDSARAAGDVKGKIESPGGNEALTEETDDLVEKGQMPSSTEH